MLMESRKEELANIGAIWESGLDKVSECVPAAPRYNQEKRNRLSALLHHSTRKDVYLVDCLLTIQKVARLCLPITNQTLRILCHHIRDPSVNRVRPGVSADSICSDNSPPVSV